MLITTHAVAGALTVAIISKLANQEPNTSLLLFGVLSALMPDIDSVGYIINKHNFSIKYNHRIFLHHPIFFILLGIILFFVLNKFWAIIFIASTLGHFCFDTITSTQGIQWLYPFSKKYYIIWPIKTLLGNNLFKTIEYGSRQKWTEDFPLSLRFSAELLIFIAASAFILKWFSFI